MDVAAEPVAEIATARRKELQRGPGDVPGQGQRRFVLRVGIDLDQRADRPSDSADDVIRDETGGRFLEGPAGSRIPVPLNEVDGLTGQIESAVLAIGLDERVEAVKALPQIVRKKYLRFAGPDRRPIQGQRYLSAVGKVQGVGMFAQRRFINFKVQTGFGGDQGVQMSTWHVGVRVMVAPAQAARRPNESAEEGPVPVMRIEGPGHRLAAEANGIPEVCAVHICETGHNFCLSINCSARMALAWTDSSWTTAAFNATPRPGRQSAAS